MTDKTEARLALEARAEELGVKFAHNIGDETLGDRIAEAEAALDAQNTQPIEGSAKGADETPGEPADLSAPDVSAAPTGDDAEPVSATGLVVRVTGPKQGRWRAGRYFTLEPVDIGIEDLSEAEKLALVDDPKLTVALIETNAGQD